MSAARAIAVRARPLLRSYRRCPTWPSWTARTRFHVGDSASTASGFCSKTKVGLVEDRKLLEAVESRIPPIRCGMGSVGQDVQAEVLRNRDGERVVLQPDLTAVCAGDRNRLAFEETTDLGPRLCKFGVVSGDDAFGDFAAIESRELRGHGLLPRRARRALVDDEHRCDVSAEQALVLVVIPPAFPDDQKIGGRGSVSIRHSVRCSSHRGEPRRRVPGA